jgi:CheY-like chemotaxis protein
MLTVSDTGHGIDKSLMDRIFEPYFTTKAQCEGSGMGLAMVHGIVKSIGGYITVSSKPKKGSIFNIYLPELDEEAVEIEMPSTGTVRGGNEHILLIDDEEDIIEMLEKMLGHFGYQITTKTSSEEALTLFCSEPNRFDLVITDQTMPKITGIELTRKVRELRPDIPVILCTGFSELITEEKLKALGVKEYIMKPIHCKEMAGIIRSVLDEKNMEMLSHDSLP